MAEHNHLTRDIKPLWSGCHGCDEYHVNALQMRIAGLLAERDAARAEVAALRASHRAALRDIAALEKTLADLRAKVKGLHHDGLCSVTAQMGSCDCLRGEVLALLDEAGQ